MGKKHTVNRYRKKEIVGEVKVIFVVNLQQASILGRYPKSYYPRGCGKWKRRVEEYREGGEGEENGVRKDRVGKERRGDHWVVKILHYQTLST